MSTYMYILDIGRLADDQTKDKSSQVDRLDHFLTQSVMVQTVKQKTLVNRVIASTETMDSIHAQTNSCVLSTDGGIQCDLSEMPVANKDDDLIYDDLVSDADEDSRSDESMFCSDESLMKNKKQTLIKSQCSLHF
uniref:Uncharacterized protein n=1 Tax=Amphimedon queenslandica TaxID=400682 RepID=A0A1X7UUW8_AMPQE